MTISASIGTDRHLERESDEQLAIYIQDRLGHDLTTDDISCAVVPVGTRPGSGDWVACAWLEHGTDPLFDIALTPTSATLGLTTPGKFSLFSKLVDNPSTVVEDCGVFTVT